METKYWVSKKNHLVVTRIGDYCTAVYNKNGLPYENLGKLIYDNGGLETFWSNCMTKDEHDELLKSYAEDKKRRDEWKKKHPTLSNEEKDKLKKQAYFELIKNNEIIPATYENIHIILSYLNTINWGSWDLPKMSIGYSAHQYDCNGKIASTIKLDEPIDLGDGDMEDKFQQGAPVGHLSKYRRC